MKSLIYNEFCMCFNRKNLKILLIVLGYIFLEVYSLYSINSIENMHAIDTDGVLRVCSGINESFSILNIMKWSFLVVILICICSNNIMIVSGFDIMLLTRVSSKGKWWICRIISLIIINLFYALFVLLTSKLLFFIVFKSGNRWSDYTNIYYKNIFNSNISPIKLEIIMFFILLTGLMCLTTLFQTVSIIFNNNLKVYVMLIIISLGLFILCEQGTIPRVMSPFTYPSIDNITFHNYGYIKSLLSNLILTVINVLVSLFIVINKDFKN